MLLNVNIYEAEKRIDIFMCFDHSFRSTNAIVECLWLQVEYPEAYLTVRGQFVLSVHACV